MYFLYILGFAFSIVAGFNIGLLEEQKKDKIINGFIYTILFSCIISVWIQLNQWFLLNGNIWQVDLPPNGRPFANMAQPNQLCTLLLMGICSILYLFENNKINKIVASFSTFFLLFGVALSQSRSAWVFTICLLIWWVLKTKNKNFKLSAYNFIFWNIIFIGLWCFIPLLTNKLDLAPVLTLNERVTQGFYRIPQWQQIIEILKASPWYGYGWGQLNVAQISNNTQLIDNPILGFSHNLFLDLLIWNGWCIGLILIIVIVYFFLKLAISIENKNTILLLTLLSPILVHSMLEYPFTYGYFLLPLGFLIGIVYSQSGFIYKNSNLNKKIYSIFLILYLLTMVVFACDYKNVNSEYQKMRYENVKLAKVNIEEEEINSIFLSHVNEYIWFVRFPLSSGLSEQTLERMRKVVYRYPDRPILYRYIQVLFLNKKDEEMVHMLNLYNGIYKEKINMNDMNDMNDSINEQL
ncbi:Wzy polymerase domain-containing protein [Acinetobacter haemolyticus]|nr:Wzy polymerase domain-containing protein [Acinetobacter haemolyticus]